MVRNTKKVPVIARVPRVYSVLSRELSDRCNRFLVTSSHGMRRFGNDADRIAVVASCSTGREDVALLR
jgi:hypothetical protein